MRSQSFVLIERIRTNKSNRIYTLQFWSYKQNSSRCQEIASPCPEWSPYRSIVVQTLQRPSSGTQRFEALWPGEARLSWTTYWKITFVVGQQSCLSDRLFLEKCFRRTYEFSSILGAENILTMNQLHIRTKQHLYVCLCFCCKRDCPRLNVGVYMCVLHWESAKNTFWPQGCSPHQKLGVGLGEASWNHWRFHLTDGFPMSGPVVWGSDMGVWRLPWFTEGVEDRQADTWEGL